MGHLAIQLEDVSDGVGWGGVGTGGLSGQEEGHLNASRAEAYDGVDGGPCGQPGSLLGSVGGGTGGPPVTPL